MTKINDVFESEQLNEKKKSEQRRIRSKEITDVKSLLKKPEGRRYIWRLLGKCGVFRNSFSLNSNQTAFSEGKRDIGLTILDEVNEADITAFSQMQNEHISALKSKKEAKDA